MGQLPLDEAYAFLRDHGLSAEAAEIRSALERFEGVSKLQLKKAKVLHHLEVAGLLDQFVEEVYPEGGYGSGRIHLSRLRTVYKRYQSGTLVSVQNMLAEGETLTRVEPRHAARAAAPVPALTVTDELHIWWNKFARGVYAGEQTRSGKLAGQSPVVEDKGCLVTILSVVGVVVFGFLIWFAIGSSEDRYAATGVLELLAIIIGACVFIGYFAFFREAPAAPPAPTSAVVVREYSDRAAYERDAVELARHGYSVISVVDQQQRPGAARIATLGFGALVWKPKPHLVVTYQRAT